MISSDIHQFSRELHPSILEKLGLVPALRRFCAEFSAHRKIVVNFASSGDEDATLVREVALVIFRVGQECLMNVSKHSCAQSCDMSLRFQRYCIVLEVTDTGKGFDPSVLKGNTGLGLQSMRERLRSVSGKLRIDSALQQGTRIYAEIPVSRIAQTAMPPQAARSDMPVT